MKKQVVVFAVVALAVALFMGGCAPKPPVMQDGKQVGLFVLSDRGIKEGMKEDERNDRNEVGQFLEENLIERLKDNGYNATLIKSQNQYIQGPANYLVVVKINDVRLVGNASRRWLGITAGPTVINTHYEASGSSNRLSLSYSDQETTFGDWEVSPKELNRRFMSKVNDKFIGK